MNKYIFKVFYVSVISERLTVHVAIHWLLSNDFNTAPELSTNIAVLISYNPASNKAVFSPGVS